MNEKNVEVLAGRILRSLDTLQGIWDTLKAFSWLFAFIALRISPYILIPMATYWFLTNGGWVGIFDFFINLTK